eukprot:scaffold18386_cov60-Phaeocystis_antarctica.AAC.2
MPPPAESQRKPTTNLRTRRVDSAGEARKADGTASCRSLLSLASTVGSLATSPWNVTGMARGRAGDIGCRRPKLQEAHGLGGREREQPRPRPCAPRRPRQGRHACVQRVCVSPPCAPDDSKEYHQGLEQALIGRHEAWCRGVWTRTRTMRPRACREIGVCRRKAADRLSEVSLQKTADTPGISKQGATKNRAEPECMQLSQHEDY